MLGEEEIFWNELNELGYTSTTNELVVVLVDLNIRVDSEVTEGIFERFGYLTVYCARGYLDNGLRCE